MKSLIFKCSIILLVVLGFNACTKDTDDDSDYEVNSTFMEHEMSQTSNFADEAYQTGNIESGFTGGQVEVRGGGCATVTKDTLSTPKTITIDFGPTNCLCKDGRYRRGKILVSYEGKYKEAGSVHTITFDGYYVNDNHIEGSKTVTNIGPDAQGRIQYAITESIKITMANGKYFERSSSRTRTWVKGYDTPTKADDEYKITGTNTTSNSKGYGFNAEITTPLLVSADCDNIKAGIAVLVPKNPVKPQISIDFGDGTCDDLATVTINGKTHIIHLK